MKIYESRVESRESSAKTRSSQVFCPRPSSLVPRPPSAFTLIEMLVVISILGLLAALLVPALKNFGHADAMTAATRQIQDDVGRARQLAISHHTTVYMVFVPANFWNNGLSVAEKALPATTNLCDKQLTGYTFVSLRSVGDQPGNPTKHYLAPWRNLPDGTFIVPQKFESAPFNAPQWKTDYQPGSDVTNFVLMNIPFPTEDSPSPPMPCIAFNYLGQLTTNGVDAVTSHEYIPLARGSVLPAIDPATKVYQLSQPDITEVPPGNSVSAYNIIDIEPLTGRTTLQQPKMK